MSDPHPHLRPAFGDHDPWEDTVSRELKAGSTVAEYVIRRRIGAGGMGIVYEAEHPRIGRRVAIKVLRPDRFAVAAAGRDLLSEAKAMGAVRHRHIIDVFGYGELPGVGEYLVMDYLEGRSLAEEMLTVVPMEPSDAMRILDDTLAALEAAHALGWVHRDLKPANLFLVRESGGTRYVKVLDFGLAKLTRGVGRDERTTLVGTMVGTPEYISPEQACGRPIDGRTDLYSLGVIAFEMLTGRLPFRGGDALQIVRAHVDVAPPAPRSIEPAIPPALEALVLRLLEKDPERRYPSADAVRLELKQLQRDRSQRPTMPLGPALPPASAPAAPKRAVSPGWVAAGVAVGLAAAGALIALRPPPQPEPPAPAPARVVLPAPVTPPPQAEPPPAVEAPADPAPRPAPALVAPPTGKLVASTLTRPQWRLLECFEKNQQALPAGAGRVEIQLTIETTGRVSDPKVVTAGLETGPLAACVVPRVAAVKFPRHPGPAVTVRVPFAYRQAP